MLNTRLLMASKQKNEELASQVSIWDTNSKEDTLVFVVVSTLHHQHHHHHHHHSRHHLYHHQHQYHRCHLKCPCPSTWSGCAQFD